MRSCSFAQFLTFMSAFIVAYLVEFVKQVSENRISRQEKYVIFWDSKINFIKQFSEYI